MAKAAHLSPRQFARRFVARLGVTPGEYADAQRVERAKALLLGGTRPARDVAEIVGFTTHSSFTRWFTTRVGIGPTAYRNDPHAA